MPKLETANYNGNERRNGSKLRLSGGDYLKIIAIIIAGVVAWTTLKLNVQALADDAQNNETKIEAVEKENHKQDEDIKVIQTSIEIIKEDVKEIRTEQKASTQLLYRILGKLDDDSDG